MKPHWPCMAMQSMWPTAKSVEKHAPRGAFAPVWAGNGWAEAFQRVNFAPAFAG